MGTGWLGGGFETMSGMGRLIEGQLGYDSNKENSV